MFPLGPNVRVCYKKQRSSSVWDSVVQYSLSMIKMYNTTISIYFTHNIANNLHSSCTENKEKNIFKVFNNQGLSIDIKPIKWAVVTNTIE